MSSKSSKSDTEHFLAEELAETLEAADDAYSEDDAIGEVLPQSDALVSGISQDLAILVREIEVQRLSLDELKEQVAVIRQVVDYVLFVTPDKANDSEDLYPFSIWLSKRFEKLERELGATLATSTASAPQAAEATATPDFSNIEASIEGNFDRLEEAIAALGSRIGITSASISENSNAARDEIRALAETLATSLGELRRQIEASGTTGEFEAHDDFDLQFDALKSFLKTQTSRWRLQENFFYGLMIVLMMVNIGMVLWLKISH